jgi:guanosine-3',5'-bis(diphosphate) 3'-pyrophosphohydrolase
MQEQLVDIESEKKEILKRYRALLRAVKPGLSDDDKKQIRAAFNMALDAHKDMRRKSGEPYILHPLAVAQIVAEDIGLDATAVVAALLHDVVEDTHVRLEEIEKIFGKKVASIVDGLTKISGVFEQGSSQQAENFRKMLLTLSDDVRVILIKLSDRLNNMRTLEYMERDKQLKIASETLYLYAPLAHRLGLYAFKTELEDLALKYTEPEVYKMIDSKLQETSKERARFIKEFSEPVIEELKEQGLKFEIRGRPKSIHSIWNKMRKQGVSFEEIYDLFAIRIIIDADAAEEKADCWKAYSVVTDFYYPNPDRLRDWISTPKANGYESLHTTVMGPSGKWVEVQIRSRRMDEVAEKGYAAHWKYKESTAAESALDEWVNKIRELLQNPDSNALDFIDEFKLNLFSDEIFVFTPTGDLKKLPTGSTALDFAFDIHTDIGAHCIGAKVNHRLVPLSHKLKSGDQVEILTSSKQKPKEDWLTYVVTARAKAKIKAALKEDKRRVAEDGKEILERKFRHLKIEFNQSNINELLLYYRLPSSQELYFRIAKEIIDVGDLKEFVNNKGLIKAAAPQPQPEKPEQSLEEIVRSVRGKSDMLVIGDTMERFDYKLSPCCNPIPGDDVFGFITINEGIKIHRVNCPNAIHLMSNYAYRIVKAKWTSKAELAFLAGIKIIGIDNVGVINKITKVISSDLKVNMRSVNFDSKDGMFEGTIMLFVHDTGHLTKLMSKLKNISGITTVNRIDTN